MLRVTSSNIIFESEIKILGFKPMDLNFKNILEFNDHFKDEATCYQFLEQQRWNSIPVCPHCGSAKKPYKVKPRGKFKDIPSYRCSDRDCDLPFTVRTGSIFEGSKVPLRKWLHAIFELVTDKNGISSIELGDKIGVSQKTAWFMNHRLRAMLVETAPEQLNGEIEVDECYIGGLEKNKHQSKRKKQGSGTVGKTPVVGIYSRGGNIITKTFDPEELNKDTIQSLINKTVHKDSVIITDGLPIYTGLDKQYQEHQVVKHNQGEYVRDSYHINTVEGFWSILSRGIFGTFTHISPQHTQKYCNEFSYRYNNLSYTNIQKFKNSMKRFDTPRITYTILTSSNLKRDTWKTRAIAKMKPKE